MINKSSQKIFNNSLLYSVGMIFSKAVGFFLVPIYTYNVSDTDYGIATTITTFVTTFGVVIMLSLRAALIRFYNEYDESEKPEFIGTITAFVTVNALAICTLLCFLHELYIPILCLRKIRRTYDKTKRILKKIPGSKLLLGKPLGK